MYDTILVPTDGSEHAIRAAEHARYLARMFDSTIHLVSAADVQTAGGLFNAGGVDRQFVERIEAENERALETTKATLEKIEPLQTAVLRGKPADAIVEYVDKHDIDLIAMGTHGRTGISRYTMGSVTEHVVRRTSCPVLTVKAVEKSDLAQSYEEVMIPTDGSDAASSAIDHGIEIAKQAEARVHAVNIVDVGAIALTPDYSAPSELVKRLETEGERAIGMVADRATDAGLSVKTSVHEGLPASDLLTYADENDVDLITMGTTGQTGLNRYLLGSTTERVIRHAEMPVMAVNVRQIAGRERATS